MILISDTLNYREDGTVSGVTRLQRDTFTTPSGFERTEDVSSVIGIGDITAGLDAAYAQFDAHNKALEQQIIDEREAAAADKAAALLSASNVATQALAALQTERDGVVSQLQAGLATRDATIADLTSRLNAALAEAVSQ